MLFGSCVAVLTLSIVLGGGTRSGFLGDPLIQLVSVPLLCVALWPVFKDDKDSAQRRAAIIVLFSAAAIVAVQIVRLPLPIWSGGEFPLPRDENSSVVPASPAWETFSLTPQATWAAAASMLAPLSIFCAVIRLDFSQRLKLCWVILGLGALSLVLGLLQVAQGTGSGLRFYSHANLTEAVGFFANRNHFAALLAICLVLVGLWAAIASEAKGWRSPSGLLLWGSIGLFFVAVMTGLVMARSRAGLLLAMIAVVVMAIIFMAARKREDPESQKKRAPAKLIITVTIIAVLFSMQVGLGRLLTRFEGDTVDNLRLRFAGATISTALQALPFGTGLGSFVPVYSTVEQSDHVRPTYANRAHNDFAEIFLETGVVGAFLVMAFLAWFARRSWAVHRKAPAGEAARVTALNRAAALIVGALLLHSVVDYPLRTSALAAIFAAFCGVLAVQANWRVPPIPKQKHRRVQPHQVEMAKVREAWAGEVAWPDSWKKTEASR